VSECEYEGVNSSRRVRLDADADDQNLAIVPTHANPGAPVIVICVTRPVQTAEETRTAWGPLGRLTVTVVAAELAAR